MHSQNPQSPHKCSTSGLDQVLKFHGLSFSLIQTFQVISNCDFLKLLIGKREPAFNIYAFTGLVGRHFLVNNFLKVLVTFDSDNGQL